MSDPIDYQTPLPAGLNLRVLESAAAVRVSRDTVSRAALWREALTPAAFWAVLLVGAWVWGDRLHRYIEARLVPPVVVLLAIPVLIALPVRRVARDAWQNSGIVTEVAVTPDTLYWRKRTLWGESEHFWPLARVRVAEVDTFNRLLKVRRDRGMPLGAFGYSDLGELAVVAGVLNRAIARFRAGAAVEGTGVPPV